MESEERQEVPDVDLEDDCQEDANPITAVIKAAHAETLTLDHLAAAGITIPDSVDGMSELSQTILCDHMADSVADCWPDPTTVEELSDLFDTALDNVQERSLPQEPQQPVDGSDIVDFDAEDSFLDDIPPLPNAPDNYICRCESAQSGRDKVRASKGILMLKLHFFFASGNIEVRSTRNRITRGDLIPLESVYALWISGDDTVNLVLSCPTMARKLTDGRWREVPELSMFPSNHPLIQIRVPIDIVEGVRAAVAVCRRMHPHILSEPTEEIPENFADPILQRTAKEYREKTVYSRVPRHIRAFAIRADPNASEEERSEANSAIVSLLSYCGTHWKVYVDTILLKRRNHGFPLRCPAYGCFNATELRILSSARSSPHQFSLQ